MHTPDKKKSTPKAGKNVFIKCYFIIAIVSFVVYANSLYNGFVFDDESVVLGDQSLESVSNIPKYFTAQEGFHKVIARYYRPVVSTTYNIDFALWKLNPLGFHLTNILINVINSILLFVFLVKVLKRIKPGKAEDDFPYIPLLGALIFAVHTVHTEAISWVSGRTDSLSFTFFIASFIYFLKYTSERDISKKKISFLLTGLFYIISLLSKEMAITLPVAVILYDVVVEKLSLDSIKKTRLKMYSALILISILYVLLRWYVLKDIPERETYFYFYGKDFATTLFTMMQAIPIYLKLLVFPAGLLYHYNGYLPYTSSPLTEYNIIFLVLLVIFITAFFYFLKQHSIISYSIMFFFLTLSPVLNIVPTLSYLAERFLYLPSVSIILIAVYIAYTLDFKKYKTAIIMTSSVIILVLGIMTILRNKDWKDNDSLFLSADDKPGTVVYVNIANIYAKKQQFDIAEKYYRKALDLHDELVLANNNLGKVLIVEGKLDSAYYYIKKAKMLDTLSPEPRFTLAQLYADKNMLPDAVSELEQLHRIQPGGYMNSKEMQAELKRRLSTDTSSVITQKSKLGAERIIQLEQESYKKFSEKDYETAIGELKQLIELNPASSAQYYNNIGMCYQSQNKPEDAKKYFELAVKTDSKFSTAYNNLGTIYEKMGDRENAKKNFKSAIDADPNNKSAVDNYNRLK